MANPIADLYNTGGFIDVPLSELVRNYILALKDGHNRAYQAIVSLENDDTALDVRVTAIEDALGSVTVADQSLVVGFNVGQVGHGFSDFDLAHFNGSSFIKAGSGVAVTGIAKVVDDNNFIYILGGLHLLPPTLTDDLGDALVQGDFYFLSSSVSGKVQKAKPTLGIYQPVYQCIIYDSVKYALIHIGEPVKLFTPIRTSITDGVGFEVRGNMEWTIPNNVFRIKATLSGGGGGGSGYENGQTGGDPSSLSHNGQLILTANGGGASKASPPHGDASGGDINIKGGGSAGGTATEDGTGGDEEGASSEGGNAGLCIKYIDVIPQDTITIVVGKGGNRGYGGGGNYGQNGVDGFCFIEY